MARRKGLPLGSQNAKDRGRPTKYRPEYVSVIRKLCEMGATDDEISDAIGVSISTFKGWRNLYPEFNEAVKAGKDAADQRVERAYYQTAVGFSYDAVKIFPPRGRSKKPIIVPYREYVPPDPTAAKHWLSNRMRDKWQIEHNVNIRAKFEMLDDESLRREIMDDMARMGVFVELPALTSNTNAEVVLEHQTDHPSNTEGELE